MQFLKRYTRFLLAALILLAGLWGTTPRALAGDLAQETPPVYIYLFWGDGCPHCAQAKPFLQELSQRYPTVQVESFEVWYVPDNQALFQQMTAAHGFEPRYVPTIFIGEQHWEGFSDELRAEIEASVKACVETGCPDAGVGVIPGHTLQPTPTPTLALSPSSEIEVCSADSDTCGDTEVAAGDHPTTLYLFYVQSCNRCVQAKPFVAELAERYPNLTVRTFEISYSPQNRVYFVEMARAFGVEAHGVPAIFVGERAWEGFTKDIGAQIEAQVVACLTNGCPDIGAPVVGPDVIVSSGSTASLEKHVPPDASANNIITLPLIGAVDLGAQSLWVSTALIAIVDGFNPCSLWVLSILIALTLRTGSRKKIFIIGLTFITVTALVYVLFIAGLFTMLTFVRFLGWIQAAVSLLALFFAAVNIKDYFWYKEGLSFTIDDAQKPGLYKRMRRVMQASDSLGALLLATVGLGVGVSLVEFSCTAGFPVLWTNLVAAQAVTPLTFALLLLLYMVIYQIDELGIFLAAVITLRASKLEEKHGRILKLIGGTLMLTLAAVMLFKPALMNDLLSSVLIFGAAFGAALLVLLVHRVILPRFGIVIGTEELD